MFPGSLRGLPGLCAGPQQKPRSKKACDTMIPAVPQDELHEAAQPVPLALNAELACKILEAAPTILYVYDVQKEQSVFQNRRIGDLLGHSPAQGADRNTGWAAYIHPDDGVRFPEHRARLKKIRPGEMLSLEFRMRDGNGNWRWFLSRDSLLSGDKRGNPLLVVGSAAEITEQKLAEQHKELLADEMRHRARNLVSIVQAIGRMSRPKDQPEANKYIDTFMGRLLTLLNTGGIVLSSASRTADLETVVNATLAPFRSDARPTRITTGGPAVALLERTAGGLALAIHELATNALKYGALSAEAGTVSLSWLVSDPDTKRRFVMEWKEIGGPPVSVPASEGFGGMVIRQSVARETDSRVVIDYLPEGLRCRLEFRISEA
jgi:PAS domain S-box-containing protein